MNNSFSYRDALLLILLSLTAYNWLCERELKDKAEHHLATYMSGGAVIDTQDKTMYLGCKAYVAPI